MATTTEAAIVRLRSWVAGRPIAGLGLLVDAGRVVTCAHVVNAALGRGQREQGWPGESDLVQVEFPRVAGAPVRLARVVAWVPPPAQGGGGDIAGLVLSEAAPSGVAPARFAAVGPGPGTRLRTFGYPVTLDRDSGMWVDLELKGEVEGQLLQVESLSGQTVKAQPGYSGSPVWDPATGQPVGLLHVTPFAEEPERDAYLLPPLAIAEAWEEPFDYLLVPENPYRGLEPFTASHAGMFFGRDADITELTRRVRAQPVVVVAGPSGAGKSSLVQAGLLPALQREQQWSVALVRPGADPWPRLAAALLRAQPGEQATVTLEDARREVDRLRQEGFGPVAEFLRSQDRPLLVVIDQFEELLASGSPDQDLLDMLLPAPEAADAAARLVLAVRADFLPFLQSIPGFHTRLNGRLYLLSPLTAEQMRLSVTCPAAAQEVAFEPLLTDQILADAAPGSLPLLEFTLTKLWETQRRRTLTFTGYRQMGGVHGALDRFAEEATARLAHISGEALDRVLLKLVRIHGQGTGLTTRQRVLQPDVPATEWDVLRRLADARLVVLDTDPTDRQPYAELTHDSLITSWHRLRVLVADSADFLSWLARVRQRAAEGDPLPEARIAEARHWLSTRSHDIPDEVRRFIDISETAAEARIRELRDARDHAEALRLAADAELALRTTHSAAIVALALGTESVLTKPTVQGDQALRHALRRHARTLSRLNHDGAVKAVAFSPDGGRVATASEDGSARVFDAATGTELSRLNHNSPVHAVVFSPDGTRLATASGDVISGGSSARVFDVATGTELARLEHNRPVHVVVFSPDGTRLATASGDLVNEDGMARVFEVASGAELARIDHDRAVYTVVFGPDGAQLATASDDGSARVFDAATGTELGRLDHHSPVQAVVFSPDGTRLATASGDVISGGSSARVFDVATGTELARLDHDLPVWAVAFGPDGTRVVAASEDGSARVFDAATGTELARLDHDLPVRAVAFGPDGTRVATASGRLRSGVGSARVFDVTGTGSELARLDHDYPVRAVAFSPDGTRVATASEDGSARVFDVATGTELARLDHDLPAFRVGFSPDGALVAVGSGDIRGGSGSAWVFEVATGTELARLDHDYPVWAVAFSPDSTRVVTASGDIVHSAGSARLFDAATGTEVARLDYQHEPMRAAAFGPDGARVTASGARFVRVFDAAAGTELARLDHADGIVYATAFSPDGALLATASGNMPGGGGSVRLFDVATGTELACLDHDHSANVVAFSPDGTRFATVSGDVLEHGSSVRLFDVATRTELARLDHDRPVWTVAFSPDGTRVATASEDVSARVFEVSTGTELARLDHDGAVEAVAFSPDSTWVATASGDGSARVFEATPEMLVQRAINVMPRPLNPTELRRYLLPPNCLHAKKWSLWRDSSATGEAE